MQIYKKTYFKELYNFCLWNRKGEPFPELNVVYVDLFEINRWVYIEHMETDVLLRTVPRCNMKFAT